MLPVCDPVIDVTPGQLHHRCLRRLHRRPVVSSVGLVSVGLVGRAQLSRSRRPGSEVQKSASTTAVAAESLTPVVVRSLCSGPRAIPALMDLALPQFDTPELQSKRPRSQWIVTHESPASPAPLRLPSRCLNLDTLSSDGSAIGHISNVSNHSGDTDQVLSDDDLPPEIHVDLISPGSPPVSARVSQCSPLEAPTVRSADSSAAISPNRV